MTRVFYSSPLKSLLIVDFIETDTETPLSLSVSTGFEFSVAEYTMKSISGSTAGPPEVDAIAGEPPGDIGGTGGT